MNSQESNNNISNLQQLEKKYEEQIRLFPESNTFVLLAEILLKQNKIQKAISVLVRGLQKNKENITARFLLAKVYYQSWNIDLAKKELIKVIRLAPDNYASAKLLIEVYKSEKKYVEALEVANGLSFYYESDEYLVNEIAQLKKLSDYNARDQLKLDYKKNIANKTRKPKENVYQNETIVNIFISQGLYKEALKILDMLIIKEPDNLIYKDKYEQVRKMTR